MNNPTYGFGMEALAEFWGQAGKAALQAQETAGRAFADSFKNMPDMMPAGTSAPLDTTGMAQAAKAMTDLWTAAAAMSNSLSSTMASGGRGIDPTIEATFRAVADPRAWFANAGGLDSVIARMADGAQLADLWNTERQQAVLMKTWLEMRRRALEHNAVVLDAWLRAGRAFTAALSERTRAEGHPPDGRVMLDLWTTTANQILLETQRSEKFLESQAAMIRAATEMRMAQRHLAERLAEQFDMPTRTELDDVHRTVTELRRQLRALRHDARAAAAPAANGGA